MGLRDMQKEASTWDHSLHLKHRTAETPCCPGRFPVVYNNPHAAFVQKPGGPIEQAVAVDNQHVGFGSNTRDILGRHMRLHDHTSRREDLKVRNCLYFSIPQTEFDSEVSGTVMVVTPSNIARRPKGVQSQEERRTKGLQTQGSQSTRIDPNFICSTTLPAVFLVV
jgi:hypothetical protein